MTFIPDLNVLLQLLQTVGPIGLLLYIYWSDQRTIRRIQEDASKQFQEMKAMYESNVVLVKNYEKIAGDMASLLTLNTQHMTRVEEKIDTNQFCPYVRVKKEKREDMA
jgi:hypothetical protein